MDKRFVGSRNPPRSADPPPAPSTRPPRASVSQKEHTRMNPAGQRGLILTLVIAASLGARDTAFVDQKPRANPPRPIRALYVTGGGFHEFVKQEASCHRRSPSAPGS